MYSHHALYSRDVQNEDYPTKGWPLQSGNQCKCSIFKFEYYISSKRRRSYYFISSLPQCGVYSRAALIRGQCLISLPLLTRNLVPSTFTRQFPADAMTDREECFVCSFMCTSLLGSQLYIGEQLKLERDVGNSFVTCDLTHVHCNIHCEYIYMQLRIIRGRRLFPLTHDPCGDYSRVATIRSAYLFEGIRYVVLIKCT